MLTKFVAQARGPQLKKEEEEEEEEEKEEVLYLRSNNRLSLDSDFFTTLRRPLFRR